jgi:hypothetical protein
MLTYFKRHFAQLNKHNLPRQHATKVIAVLLQYIKALQFSFNKTPYLIWLLTILILYMVLI